MKNKIIYLIFLLTFLIRFIGLSNLPPALNRDEAAIGWNAYSILKTTRDEHGQFMPLAFKSIGDYKMPLYIYLTTIPIKLFGLNDFSIRFWSALAGVVSVIALYFITKKLTKNQTAAIITAGLMALNPWAVFYSRVGFEANLSLAFFLTGLCLILKGLKKNIWFYLGLSLFLLSFLTYSSSLIFTPLFLVFFIIFYRKKISRPQFIGLIIFCILSALIFRSIWNVSSQKSNITIFSNPTVINYYNTTRTDINNQNPFLARTWWNQKVFWLRLITQNYFKNFNYKFLLTVGGNHPWHRIPSIGSFYYLEIALAAIGFWWLLVKSKNLELKIILLTWLLLAPIPSAITVDAPHPTRSLHLLPVMLIFSALGFLFIYKLLKSKKNILILIGVFYFFNIIFATYQYLYVYPKNFSGDIPLGLKQLIIQHPVTDNAYFYDIQSSTYLYPLVYAQPDPGKFQNQAVWTKPDLTNLTNVYQFDQFTIVNNPEDIINPSYVIWPSSEPLSLPNLKLVDQSGFYNLYLSN